MGNTNVRVRELIELFKTTSDAFETLIADSTNNPGDIGSHFRFSPQVLRLYEQGEREFLLYDSDFIDTGSNAIFDDTDDVYTLSPGADNTLTLQTARRFRYVVAYESEFSAAWATNRELEAGESVRITFDGSAPDEPFNTDCHGIEYDAEGVRQFITRNGERVRSREVDNAQPVTAWTMYANQFNWYNAGQKRGRESYSDGRKQQNVVLGSFATDRTRGPRVGNGRISVEVETGAASDLELLSGSQGFKNLGQISPTVRDITFPVEATVDTADTYVPIAALRKNQRDFPVTVDLTDLLVQSVEAQTKFLVIAVDPSETDATGFEQPNESNQLSNAVELTTNVSTMPDNTGAEVSSADNPGGYQITYNQTTVSGSGNNRIAATGNTDQLARLHDTDVALLCANAGSTGAVELDIPTRQER